MQVGGTHCWANLLKDIRRAKVDRSCVVWFTMSILMNEVIRWAGPEPESSQRRDSARKRGSSSDREAALGWLSPSTLARVNREDPGRKRNQARLWAVRCASCRAFNRDIDPSTWLDATWAGSRVGHCSERCEGDGLPRVHAPPVSLSSKPSHPPTLP